jgi:TATA-box binding protein (TBP) (component of TFIID and TFIIIB)
MFSGVLSDCSTFKVDPIVFKDKEEEEEEGEGEGNSSIPRVVNVVSTVRLTSLNEATGKPYKLPLQSMSMRFPVMQYSPKAFASLIGRIKDGDKIFTCLFFSSGKAVFVKCLSPNHSINESQKIRRLLNEIEVVMMDTEGRVYLEKLGNRLDFLEWKIQNVVLSANLGFRIKLEELATVAPHRVKYEPGKFPGAEIDVSVKSRSQCTCTKSKKCGCTVTLLVFEEGAVIVGGSKTAAQGNSVYFRFLSVAKEFRNDGIEYQKKDRYQTRIKKFAELLADVDDITSKKEGTFVKEEEEEEQQQHSDLSRAEEEEAVRIAIRDALEMLNISCTKYKFVKNIDTSCNSGSSSSSSSVFDNNITTNNLLLEACLRHQIQNAKFLLECNMVTKHDLEETLVKLKLPETDPIVQVLLSYRRKLK